MQSGDLHLFSSRLPSAALVVVTVVLCGCSGDDPMTIRIDFRQSDQGWASDGSGAVWLFVGTDSGFESTTSVYYTQFTARFQPI